ncbi:putative protein YqgN [compost metagenome]
MTRTALRKQALKQRMELSEEDCLQRSEKLLEGFKRFNFQGINVVHIFLPIKSKKEPDTLLMIDWLMRAHPEIKILVPRADFGTHTMSSHLYPGPENLVWNAYGIPEPVNEAVELKADLIVVPLLAFDDRGHRLGYGKGFYDRFLHGQSAQKVGLSFFDAVPEIMDVHENDIRLDYCITPDRVVKFTLQ